MKRAFVRGVPPSIVFLFLLSWAACSDLTPPTSPDADARVPGLAVGDAGYPVITGSDLHELLAESSDGESWAFDVNRGGEIVGKIDTNSKSGFVFVDDAEQSHDIGDEDWPFLYAASQVNVFGTVVGYGWSTPEGGPRGYRWSLSGGMETLFPNTGSPVSTYAYDISNGGRAVGYVTTKGGADWAPGDNVAGNVTISNGDVHSVRAVSSSEYVAGLATVDNVGQSIFRTAPTDESVQPAGTNYSVFGINVHGDVVGVVDDKPYVWDEHQLRWLDLDGASSGEARDVSSPETSDALPVLIIGNRTVSGQSIATVWNHDGTIAAELQALGGPELNSYAMGLNEDGLIVGYSDSGSGVLRATSWSFEDDGGGNGGGDLPSTIPALEQAVEDLFDEGSLNMGQANALLTKLEKADKKERRGKDKTAANILGAFINQLEDLVAEGVLTADEAAPLIAGANLIIDDLLD